MLEEVEGSDSARHAYPAELTGALPRKVQFDSNDGSWLLFVGMLFGVGGIIVCAIMCFGTFRHMQQRADLRRLGSDTAGVVSNAYNGRGDHKVVYQFTVNGVVYRGQSKVPFSLRFHESDQIAIRYLPSNPDISHPADWEWSGLTDILPKLLIVVFTALGSIALAALLMDRQLARRGKVAEGVVTNCVRNKKSQFRVEYEFCAESGTRTNGSCNCWEEYEAGDHIWIMYLANKPRMSHSYPLLYFGIVA